MIIHALLPVPVRINNKTTVRRILYTCSSVDIRWIRQRLTTAPHTYTANGGATLGHALQWITSYEVSFRYGMTNIGYWPLTRFLGRVKIRRMAVDREQLCANAAASKQERRRKKDPEAPNLQPPALWERFFSEIWKTIEEDSRNVTSSKNCVQMRHPSATSSSQIYLLKKRSLDR